MFARVATFEGGDNKRLMELTEERRASGSMGMPEGLRGAVVLDDDAAGKRLFITFFDSREAIASAEAGFDAMGDEIPDDVRGRRTGVGRLRRSFRRRALRTSPAPRVEPRRRNDDPGIRRAPASAGRQADRCTPGTGMPVRLPAAGVGSSRVGVGARRRRRRRGRSGRARRQPRADGARRRSRRPRARARGSDLARPLGQLLPGDAELEPAAAGLPVRRRRSRRLHAARRDRRVPRAVRGRDRDAPARRRRRSRRSPTTDGGGFLLGTSAGELHADRVVLATGAYQRPHRPPVAATLPPTLHQLDVEGYRNERELPPGGVLVVGSGQSGCQIAEELHEAGRDVVLACGKVPWGPRRFGGHDLIWWAVETGFADATVRVAAGPGRPPRRQHPRQRPRRRPRSPPADAPAGGRDAHRALPRRRGRRGALRVRPLRERGLGRRAPRASSPASCATLAAERGIDHGLAGAGALRGRRPRPDRPRPVRDGALRDRLQARLRVVAALAGGVRRARLPAPRGRREHGRPGAPLRRRPLPAEAQVVALLGVGEDAASRRAQGRGFVRLLTRTRPRRPRGCCRRDP